MSNIEWILIIITIFLVILLFRYIQLKKQIRNLADQVNELNSGNSQQMLDISLIDKDLEWNLLKNVFICETFSKTQIGIIILSVIYNSMGAFMGGLLSFVFLLSLLALKGEFISKIINEQTMMYTSGFFLIVFSIEILYYNY